MARLGKGLHLLVEQAFQVVKRRIAFGQVAEARIARIALIAMLAAPRAARAVLLGEQAAAFLQLFGQLGRADIGFVEIGGEESATGHEGRERTVTLSEKGRGYDRKSTRQKSSN